MSKYFFVDYENVGSLSLMGIENLCSDDKLIIVLTNNVTNRINIDLVRKLSKAMPMKIAINTLEKHDAADFRIIAEIGICMRYIRKTKDQIYILTEDRGFDAAIIGFRAAGYDISRNVSINNVYNSEVNHKRVVQHVTSKIYGYKLCITQFDEEINENEIANQKALIKIVYLMYRASKSLEDFETSLTNAGFNGFVVNSLMYIFKELIQEEVL